MKITASQSDFIIHPEPEAPPPPPETDEPGPLPGESLPKE